MDNILIIFKCSALINKWCSDFRKNIRDRVADWDESTLKYLLSDSKIKKAMITTPNRSEDFTHRISWLLSEDISYTDLRKYFYKNCDHYDNLNISGKSYEINLVIETDKDIYMDITIDITKNIIYKITSVITQEPIMFDTIDLNLVLDSSSDDLLESLIILEELMKD